MELTKGHQQWLQSIHVYADSLNITNLLKGNVVEEQVLAYRQIVQTSLSQQRANNNQVVVCETGFFQGVSSHLWMDTFGGRVEGERRRSSNSTVGKGTKRRRGRNKMTLHSFDLDFPEANVAKLQETFSNRGAKLVLHKGNTRDTLPTFQPPKSCNLLSIDGSHDGWDPYLDLVDLLPQTKCGSIVLYDDTFDSPLKEKGDIDNTPGSSTFFNYCSKSYWRAVNEGLIEHVNCQDFGIKSKLWGAWPKGYCVAIARGGNCQS